MQNFFIDLALLLMIGIIIGLDRHKRIKAVGIRTITLVLIGAFVYSYMSVRIGGDPSRVIAQVVTGVGFIGGGIIFKNGVEDIRNLTTAVLIWAIAAVGCLVALSYRVEAVVIALVILFVLRSNAIIDKYFKQDDDGEKF